MQPAERHADIFQVGGKSYEAPVRGRIRGLLPLPPKWAWGKVEATAEKQIYDDGALIARVNIFEETASGVVTADIHARYKE